MTRTVSILRALTAARSFESMVAPAVADFHRAQVDGASRLAVARRRAGVVRALAGAMIGDAGRGPLWGGGRQPLSSNTRPGRRVISSPSQTGGARCIIDVSNG